MINYIHKENNVKHQVLYMKLSRVQVLYMKLSRVQFKSLQKAQGNVFETEISFCFSVVSPTLGKQPACMTLKLWQLFLSAKVE